jgi:hypothetical protein
MGLRVAPQSHLKELERPPLAGRLFYLWLYYNCIMPRWEYNIVEFSISGHEDTFNREKEEIEKILNIRGSIGFELVSFTPKKPGYFLAIFKREQT